MRETAPGIATLQRPDGQAVRILFLVTEDWYFWSHRLALARAAREAGASVIVATRVERLGRMMADEGFEVVALPWRRRSSHPVNELRALAAIVSLYRRERPDIVHHVAIKPVVYGGIAARLANVPARVNAIAGMGYLETSRHHRARVLRGVFRAVLRFAWSGGGVHVIVQNPDDRDAVIRSGLLDASSIHMIRGSGVDVSRFAPTPEPATPRVRMAYVGRFLWSKGMRELVDAARRLREREAPVDVLLVGNPDPENPESVPERQVQAWIGEGLVTQRDWTDDVAGVWRDVHAAVFPSYREGLPKALLEAAASARAIVATDVPGCREIARDGVNALCVPARDAESLANAMERLAGDAALRARLGAAGREIVVREFAQDIVVGDTLSLYRQLAAAAPAS